MTSFMNGPFAHWREFSVANNVSLLAYSLPHRCCSHPVRFVLAARIAWPTKNEKNISCSYRHKMMIVFMHIHDYQSSYILRRPKILRNLHCRFDKSTVEISQRFVAFWECINFIKAHIFWEGRQQNFVKSPPYLYLYVL